MTESEQFMEQTFFCEELSINQNLKKLEKDCFHRPEVYLEISPYSLSLLEKVKSSFQKAGWDGEGRLGLLYVQPFISKDYPNEMPKTLGTFMWEAEQKNADTSFLGVYPKSFNSVMSRCETIGEHDDLLWQHAVEKGTARISPDENNKKAWFEKQNGKCPICQEIFDITEIANEMTPWIDNGIILPPKFHVICNSCNENKGNKDKRMAYTEKV